MKRVRPLSSALDGNVQIFVHWFIQPGHCDSAARLQIPMTASQTSLGAKLNYSRQQNVPEWQVYSGDGAATGSVADSQCGTFTGWSSTRKRPSQPRPQQLAQVRVALAPSETWLSRSTRKTQPDTRTNTLNRSSFKHTGRVWVCLAASEMNFPSEQPRWAPT